MESLVTHNGLELCGNLDADGDLSIFFPESIAYDWITREDAVMIIEHLQKVFEITG